MTGDPASSPSLAAHASGTSATVRHDFINSIIHTFLYTRLAPVLILLAMGSGVAALLWTPREEDPQIVVPLADVHVRFPGHRAEEVEKLVATPLEKLLYQIDGVEYVYSFSRENEAVITVRFFVGEDRERSLVKLYKRIDEHRDIVPPGVTGWVVKPVEIDDVPIVALTLRSAESDEYTLRRVAEEMVDRLAAVRGTSRANIIGGRPRVVNVYLDPDRMQGYGVTGARIRRAIKEANLTVAAGAFSLDDSVTPVEVSRQYADAEALRTLVIGVHGDRSVFLRDVAEIVDGPGEATSYVRHGWGPARGFGDQQPDIVIPVDRSGAFARETSAPAVTIALSKQKGSNAVTVADDILAAAGDLERMILPDNIEMVVTRNNGQTADEKVNELVGALGVAIVIVIALLTLGLGGREAMIVALAVPVVFGLTLGLNLLMGYTINRVTLFALILSLELLVDDPIVDVENISRHFALRRRADRSIVMEAVPEVRPPLIAATLAVIVSFLPLFFITGMMGPYMRPMALNVPVAMLLSMVVAFTITPWLSYHVLRRKSWNPDAPRETSISTGLDPQAAPRDVKSSALYRFFYPLMAPLLNHRWAAWLFLAGVGLLTIAATGLAATRQVPLKMLPFDNKTELLLVLDFDEGTTLERTDAGVRALEAYLAKVADVTDFTSYVGVASPIDFNGLVRHYYLRRGENVAELRSNLAPKKNRRLQSHAIGLLIRDDVVGIARERGANVKIVEIPPGPPVISTLVAEIRGRPDQSYDELIAAAATVRNRLQQEPGVADVDDSVEAPIQQARFVVDQEKAALDGVSVEEIGDTLSMGLGGEAVGTLYAPRERRPLPIVLRLPRFMRSSTADLGQLHVPGRNGDSVIVGELGRWEARTVDQTIFHKNLERVVYVFGETAGRAPAEVITDLQADFRSSTGRKRTPAYWTGLETSPPRPPTTEDVTPTSARRVADRTYLKPGGSVPWTVPEGIHVDFAGEGEWKITREVFRDLGLAFAAALAMIFVILAAQTGSFVIPIVVMSAIPLTLLGIMPGFWLLNALTGVSVGGYADPVFFTATGMIGVIALTGIVTRDSIILVDFIQLSLRRGRTLFDAILESRVVRLRPILLTTGTAMLSAIPIALDPIFSGLAWSLIFGLLASTVFTLFVIPITYWLVFAERKGARRVVSTP